MTCKNCEKRKIGCHSTCEEYIEECKQREQKKKELYKKKNAESEITAIEVERRKRYGRNR